MGKQKTKLKLKTGGWEGGGYIQVFVKGKQFLKRHPPCYSYIQSSPVKVLTVIVYTSQLIRYSRACAQYSDFLDRVRLLT